MERATKQPRVGPAQKRSGRSPLQRLIAEQSMDGPSAALEALRSEIALRELLKSPDGPAPVIEPLANTISALEFDLVGGVLLAAVSTGVGGSISLFNFESIRRGEDGTCVLALPSQATTAVRWDPANDQLLACSRYGSDNVSVYNIETCDEMRPTFTYKPKRSSLFLPPCGLVCLEYDARSPGVFVGGARDSTISLWDSRVSTMAVKEFVSPNTNSLRHVLMANHSLYVFSPDSLVELDTRRSAGPSILRAADDTPPSVVRTRNLRTLLGFHSRHLLAVKQIPGESSLCAWLWADGEFGLLDLAKLRPSTAKISSAASPKQALVSSLPVPRDPRYFGALRNDMPVVREKSALAGTLTVSPRGLVCCAEANDVRSWTFDAKRAHVRAADSAPAALGVHPSEDCLVVALGRRLTIMGDWLHRRSRCELEEPDLILGVD